MATHHILNGDCLADLLRQTTINQDFIICRECFIEGDLYANSSNDFWSIRARFIAETYNISLEDYYSQTVSEFEKIATLPDNSEICLWFENDLFCQTNMWFVISLLANHTTSTIFRVFPIIENNADNWKGFGIATPEKLEKAYSLKMQFSHNDLELGEKLWAAYQSNDIEQLSLLAKSESDCFECLEEVCQAHIDRFPANDSLGRPEKVVKEIIETKSKEFHSVFAEFAKREGVYGFGDLQIKSIYHKYVHSQE